MDNYREMIEQVRKTGKVNMADKDGVVAISSSLGLYSLAAYLDGLSIKEYAKFLTHKE